MGARPLGLTVEYVRASGRRNGSRVRITARSDKGGSFTDCFDIVNAVSRTRAARTLSERFKTATERQFQSALETIADAISAPEAESSTDPEQGGDSVADFLVAAIRGDSGVELFRSSIGSDATACASIVDEVGRSNLRVEDREFRQLLVGKYFVRTGLSASPSSLLQAQQTLASIALHGEDVHSVHVRLAEHDECLWLDLANDDHEVVRVGHSGWRIVSDKDAPVRFLRPRGVGALPTPKRGGSINELRRFVNVPDEASWILLVATMVAFLRPRGPYPVLVVHGVQGAAKSWLCRVIRRLIDPNSSPLRRPPKNEQDLLISATNSFLLVFENCSKMSDAMSDAVCAVATGGGLGTRRLYTDHEEQLFSVCRGVIINGIDGTVTRPDLLDRAVVLTLPPIEASARRDEASLSREFELAAPRILGALLDGVTAAWTNVDGVNLLRLPRMADFTKWATAAEPGLGWEPGTFVRAYEQSHLELNAMALEASPVGVAVLQFMERRKPWRGTASELLAELARIPGPDNPVHRPDWPRQPHVFSGLLRRIQPVLTQHGVRCDFLRASTADRARMIELERIRVGRKSDRRASRASEGSKGQGGESNVGDGAEAHTTTAFHAVTGADSPRPAGKQPSIHGDSLLSDPDALDAPDARSANATDGRRAERAPTTSRRRRGGGADDSLRTPDTARRSPLVRSGGGS